MQSVVKDFIKDLTDSSFLSMESFHFDKEEENDNHDLELAKMTIKYKFHDTTPLKLEIYSNFHNSLVEKLDDLSLKVDQLLQRNLEYKIKIQESERIKQVYFDWIIKLNHQTQVLTDRIIELRSLRDDQKKSKGSKMEDLNTLEEEFYDCE